jgi:hypothetical protein
MKIPEFTAEASLLEIRSYRTNGVVSVAKASAVVSQQKRFDVRFSRTLSLPPMGPVFFKCGWNPKTLTSECTCSGDVDCNRMFEAGVCGDIASCDTGTGTCRCDLRL